MDKNHGNKLGSRGPGPVAQCVAEVDPRGRIRIPSAFIKGVEWIKAPSTASDTLRILDEPGRIIFLPWVKYGTLVDEKRNELIESGKDSPEVCEALLILEDRYKHLQIPADLRPTLTMEDLLHLDLKLETKCYVYLRKIFDAIEIVSVNFRNKQRMRRLDLLDGLP